MNINLLATPIAAAALSLASPASHAQWNVEKDSEGATITTFSESGAMLSAMCLLRHGRCQWAVVMPDADCKIGSRVAVTILGHLGTLIVKATCKSMPTIRGMPGAGRLMMLDAPSALIEPAVALQDATVSIRIASGRFAQYTFPSEGAAEALSEAGNWLRHINAQQRQPSIYPSRNEFIGNTESVLKERNQ